MSRRRSARRFHIQMSEQTKEGILSVLFFSIAILLTLSLTDSAGAGGRSLDGALAVVFGWVRVVLPVAAAVMGYSIARGYFPTVSWRVRVGFVLLLVGALPGLGMLDQNGDSLRGGIIGAWAAQRLQESVGPIIAAVIVIVMVVVASILITDRSWELLRTIGRMVKWGMQSMGASLRRAMLRSPMRDELVSDPGDQEGAEEKEESAPRQLRSGFLRRTLTSAQHPSKPVEEQRPAEQPLTSTRKRRTAITPCYSVDLLESQTGSASSGDTARAMSIIEKTLKNFGIEVEMGQWRVGPTVTQYTLKPAEGVKLSQITALHNDLALALAAHPIRIEAPIPGKSLVGIEVPNQRIAIVRLKNILTSPEYQELSKQSQSPLLFALGQDVAGAPWIGDLARMPHLLIAGATGSGKTIMMNTLIMSLLYRNTPEELRLLLVDPKRVELPVYNGIPHLVTPAITDVRKTINALRWLIGEMDRRFDELSRTGHRDISSYNAKEERGMPYLVAIIDELADLMSTAANEVEAAIIRLAQMARAVGIHLVLATQRPSVDVITGLIKANITARIAFSVASTIDSRTILDQPGADKLLGRGDMLFLTAELSKPKRIQGAFITDAEIKQVTEFLRSKGGAQYDETVVERPAAGTAGGAFSEDDRGDPLLAEARDLIVRSGKGSASMLQRRLKVGYARAARLLDLLEEQGVIGPADGAKPREVLIAANGGDTMSSDEEDQLSTDDEGYGDTKI
ncbi:DNA translocase FtsK [Candidatus Uhrbacteria bacterium]|nr:DNA translocase FtsK [Candidatus Uhrbacteria bacterium]